MAVTFHNEGSVYKTASKRRIAAWLRDAVCEEGFSAGDIALVFCSPEKHLEINRAYLNHDYRTDVITFDYTDHEKKVISGDIFIDPGTVADNAAVFETDPDEEMHRVMVHGVLHLCGYDDHSDGDRAIMRSKEDHYLAKLLKYRG